MRFVPTLLPHAERQPHKRAPLGSQHLAHADVVRDECGDNAENSTGLRYPVPRGVSGKTNARVGHPHDAPGELRSREAREGD